MALPAQSLVIPTVPRLPSADELPCADGMPMETLRHRLQMELLIHSLEPWAAARGDVYVSGNQFVYFSPEQVRSHDFRGPDVFVVCGVSPHERKSWVVWEEGKAPDVVIELLSASTTANDKKLKQLLYQNELRVANYFWMDPYAPEDRSGFILQQRRYHPIQRNADGCLPVPSLGLQLCLWRGKYLGVTTTWLRWANKHGLLLLPEEAEKQRADIEQYKAIAERQRADIEQHKAAAERQRADIEQYKALAERQRADIEQHKAAAERQRADIEQHKAAAERQRADIEQHKAVEERQRAEAAEQEIARLHAELARLRSGL